AELVVEIPRAAECSARQKRSLEVVVGSFDDPLVLGFARFEHHHLGAQHTAERLTVAGQFGAPGPPPPDRTFTVPDQGAWHRTQRVDQLPPPGEQILSPP